MTTSDRTKRLARLLLAMAWDRKTWKSHLLGNYKAALEHFYYVQLAQLNGQTKTIQHWKNELWAMLGDRAIHIFLRDVKGRWDKWKAISEVVADLRLAEQSCFAKATTHVQITYGLKKMKTKLPPGVSASFYTELEANVTKYLSQVESR